MSFYFNNFQRVSGTKIFGDTEGNAPLIFRNDISSLIRKWVAYANEGGKYELYKDLLLCMPFFLWSCEVHVLFPLLCATLLRPLVLICMCFLLQTSVVGTMLLLDLSLVVKKFQIAAM